MRQLIFIRHGESQANKDAVFGVYDAPLTQKGVDQAHQAGRMLKCMPDLIVASPQPRALATAEVIAKEAGYSSEIVLNKKCVERFYGVLDGQPGFVGNTDSLDISGDPTAESLEAMFARAESFYGDIRAYDADTIVVVSHGAFGRALQRVVGGLQYDDEVDFIENATPIRLV